MPFDDGGTIHLAFINEAKTPLGCDLKALADAIQVQVTRDLSPAWGLPDVKITVEDAVPAGAWGLIFLDDADQEDALGYHDLTPEGQPQGKVFVATTINDGQIVSVTASHEACEQLIDPGVNLAAQGYDGSFYAWECSDAVEDKTYDINGIAMSDFVFPAWFEAFRAHQDAKFDFLDILTHPFSLTEGGYISVFTRGKWLQRFGSRMAQRKFNPKRKHRSVRRMKAGR